jgi:hypothetical protein
MVPLNPGATNNYGNNCVGLRFPPRSDRHVRDQEGGRDRSYHHRHKREREQQFYTVGLQYVPKKGDSNVYRTVVIDMMPLGTKLEDVLEFAKEYPIVSSRLIDTSRMKLKGADEGVVGTVSSHALNIATALSQNIFYHSESLLK